LTLTGCAKRYRVEGMVLGVRPDPPAVTVSHRAIPGVMPAMAMQLPVERPGTLDGVRPGTRIDFDLKVSRSRSVIARIRRLEERFDFPVASPAEATRVGDAVPDFELTDQSGRHVRLSDFRGRVVAVQFLYTRCPLPDVCPRLAASFASLRKRFVARMGSELLLLSITLDPQYDTPAVLLEYSRRVGADGEGWRLLTGDTTPPARRFGLLHWAEEGVIVHSSRTAIVDRGGKLAALVDGSGYRLEQLADLVRSVLDKEKS
jgi:protein SCO1/2